MNGIKIKDKKRKINLFISIFFVCIFLMNSCATDKISDRRNSDAMKNIMIEYQNIADTFMAQEKYDKAVSYYILALENKDTYWNVYYKLARAYVFQKNWSEAEKMFIELKKRDSENSSIKASLAYVYSMNGNLSDARQIYSELIEEFPEMKDYLENYISILIAEENFEEFNEKFENLKEKFPESEKISVFEKEYEKYIQKQKELYPEKFAEENIETDGESEKNADLPETNQNEQADNRQSVIKNSNVQKNSRNPEESNLEIEDILDEEQ